ncbi:MAG: hypothetical protein M1426_01060 [Patescibacteria group bacterium]|nr:hypothetical protein [Patescibacteria group bacterium]
MANPELNHQGPELAPKQEATLRLINGTRAVIIFGRNGVGQSNLGKNVASCLGGVALYDGGRKIRTATGNTPGTTEFMPRDVSLDHDIDETQKRLIRQASPDIPIVIVAKLGGYNALKLMLENPSIKVVRVLATCGRDEAIRRVTRRKISEITQDYEKLNTQLGLGEINSDEYTEKLNELFIRQAEATRERILHETQERERKDFKQWAQAYPELAGIDVFDPDAHVLIMGHKQSLYDIRISTTKRRPRQSADFLADKLVEAGFAERVKAQKPAESTPITQNGTIFEA